MHRMRAPRRRSDPTRTRPRPERPRTGWVRGLRLAVAFAALLTACTGSEAGEGFLGVQRVTPAMHNDLPGLGYSTNYRRSGLDWLMFQNLDKHFPEVEFSDVVDVSSAERITQLEQNKADMTIASFSITRERMQRIDFVGPYLTTWQGFLVAPENRDIATVAGLRGKHICVWEGTTSEHSLAALAETTGVEPRILSDASDCIDELVAGRVDALSTDQTILYGFAQAHRKHDLHVLRDVTIGAPQHYGIGIGKGNDEDCQALVEWLKGYVTSNDWADDVATSLPLMVEENPEWLSVHKPNTSAIDARSCRDEPSP